MAIDVQARIKARTQGSTSRVAQALLRRGIRPKRDLNTREGLFQTAQDEGGSVAEAARRIIEPERSLEPYIF